MKYSARCFPFAFCVALLLFQNACERPPAERLSGQFGERLASIHDAHSMGQYVDHAAYTAATLQIMSGYPIEALLETDQPLRTSIQRDGVAPYLSILIEYSYRLSRAPTERSIARHQELSRMYWGDRQRWEADVQDMRPTVVIRSISRETSFRPFSQNAGFAMAAIAMSKLGRSQMANGSRPESLLRLAELLRSCEELLEPDSLPDINGQPNGRDRCERLQEAIENRLAEDDPGPSTQVILDALAGGTQAGPRSCIAGMADHSLQRFVAEVEAYNACVTDELTQPGDPLADYAGNSFGDWGTYVNLDEFLDDYDETGQDDALMSDEDVGVHGKDSFWSYSTHYQHKDDPDKTATVTNYWVWDDEGSRGGTSVTVNDDQGSTVTHYDVDGQPTAVNWQSSSNDDVTYRAEYSDGELVEEEWVDSNGTTTRVTYDEEGTATTVKWDSNGICIENCANQPDPEPDPETTRPVDPVSQCKVPNPQQYATTALNDLGPLGPWINPGPDDVPAVYTDCLQAFAGRNASEHPVCPYVAVCLNDAPPNEDCLCDPPAFDPRPSMGPTCALINCGETQCNPSTGVCEAPATGNPLPGVLQPYQPPVQMPGIPPVQGMPSPPPGG